MGSIKGQDVTKAVVGVYIIVATILLAAGSGLLKALLTIE
jgi:hypothetical protein